MEHPATWYPFFLWCLGLTVILMGSRFTQEIKLWVHTCVGLELKLASDSICEVLFLVNYCGKPDFNCGQGHSWDPALYKMQNMSWAQESTVLCFWIVEAICGSCFQHLLVDFSTMMTIVPLNHELKEALSPRRCFCQGVAITASGTRN